MIKRREIIYTEKRKSEIIGNIMMDLDSNPPLTWDYLTKFEKVIDSPKRFIGRIRQDEVSLHSKGLIYWPKAKVELESVNSQTAIKITYKSFWLYTVFYLLFVTILLLSLIGYYTYEGSLSENQGADVLWFFIVIFSLLPFLGRWLQKNLIKFLLE